MGDQIGEQAGAGLLGLSSGIRQHGPETVGTAGRDKREKDKFLKDLLAELGAGGVPAQGGGGQVLQGPPSLAQGAGLVGSPAGAAGGFGNGSNFGPTISPAGAGAPGGK